MESNDSMSSSSGSADPPERTIASDAARARDRSRAATRTCSVQASRWAATCPMPPAAPVTRTILRRESGTARPSGFRRRLSAARPRARSLPGDGLALVRRDGDLHGVAGGGADAPAQRLVHEDEEVAPAMADPALERFSVHRAVYEKARPQSVGAARDARRTHLPGLRRIERHEHGGAL